MVTWYEELLQITSQGGLSGLIECASANLNGQVILVEGDLAPIVYQCGSPITWTFADASHFLATMNSRPDALSTEIVLKDHTAGYVIVETKKPIDRALLSASLDSLSRVCALEISKNRAVVEAQLELRGGFVEELLTNSYQSIEAIRQRAKFIGYNLYRPHTVAVFDLDRFARYIAQQPSRDEATIVRLKDRFIRLLSAKFVEPQALAWHYSDSFVVLLPTLNKPLNEVILQIERVRTAVQLELHGPSVSVGVGRVYDRPERFHKSYAEANQSVTIGLTMNGDGCTTPFDALGVYRLLYKLRGEPELAEFCAELLGPVERYDRTRGTDLLQTLEHYLLSNANVARATEALHLHRNGLLYRLQRLSDITGADFNDAHTRLSYHLAILARTLDAS